MNGTTLVVVKVITGFLSSSKFVDFSFRFSFFGRLAMLAGSSDWPLRVLFGFNNNKIQNKNNTPRRTHGSGGDGGDDDDADGKRTAMFDAHRLRQHIPTRAIIIRPIVTFNDSEPRIAIRRRCHCRRLCRCRCRRPRRRRPFDGHQTGATTCSVAISRRTSSVDVKCRYDATFAEREGNIDQ